MNISYKTKEESNKVQEDYFLSLSGAERILLFFSLSRRINKFPSKKKKENSSFIISK
ncbi:MAG: hypothetical protein ACPGVD_05755 [Flavobacteriales bacterium]